MFKHDFERTILSQYSNSGKLISLLQKFNDQVDPRMDIEKFYQEVFNLDTCGEYGLDVWGRIVAAPRTIEIETTDYFGFDGQELLPFDQAPFYENEPITETVILRGDAYRKLIYFKAYCNIIHTTLPNIDKALWMLFGDNRAPNEDMYAQEYNEGVMTMRFIFRFALSPLERGILRKYGGLLRPAGVWLKVYEIPYDVFGFDDSDLQPFDQGTFWNGSIGEVNSIDERNNYAV